MPHTETKHQRAQRLAREAAKRMASKPCARTRRTLFKHIKEGLE